MMFVQYVMKYLKMKNIIYQNVVITIFVLNVQIIGLNH